MRRLLLGLLLCALGAAIAAAQAPPPLATDRIAANRYASPAARKVLTLLRALPDRPAARLMLGQDAGPSDGFDARAIREVAERGGKYPAIVATDYTARDPAAEECLRVAFEQNPALADHWRNGGLPLVRASLQPPSSRADGGCAIGRRYDARRLLPGGADRAVWLASLDRVAAGLAELGDTGIVVLFNPLDGAGEGGAWWRDLDPRLYGALWRDLFDHFTGALQLSNLLWVYDGRPSHYPGSDVVDVLSERLTGGDPGPLRAFAAGADKPYGFFHTAGVDTAPVDFVAFLHTIRTTTPEAIFVVTGLDADRFGSPRNRGQRDMTYDPWLLDRDEIQLHAYLEGRAPRR